MVDKLLMLMKYFREFLLVGNGGKKGIRTCGDGFFLEPVYVVVRIGMREAKDNDDLVS